MKKVMVFGAGGWLGRKLVERLSAEKRQIICIDLKMGNMYDAYNNVETIEADVRNTSKFTERFKECDSVFNCCGALHPRKVASIYAVNRDVPVTLYKLCIQNNVRTFAHISSIAAYGENKSGIDFINEEQLDAPITSYGKSKAQADLILKSLVSETTTRLIILRPGVFYGLHPSPNLYELLEKIRTTSMPTFSRHGFLRTYTDIEQVVTALILSEENGTSGEIYCIGDREPISTMRFYKILAEELNTPLKVVRVPLLVSRCAEITASVVARLGLHLRLPTIVGEFGRHTFVSLEKAERELGFLPLESSEAGLRAMVKSIYGK